MRVAILGGTGFIGRHVARTIVAAGADVTTIQRGTGHPPVAALRADRTRPDELAAALAVARPDVLIDMIAYQQSDSVTLVNVLPATLERLVVISSGDVYATYGRFLGLPGEAAPGTDPDEKAPLRHTLFPYRGRATGAADLLFNYEKILVEQAARAWGGSVTVLRLPMVYGPGDPQRRVEQDWDRLQVGGGVLRLHPAEASWRTTRGYVEDVAAAIGLATLAPAAVGETFNVGEPDALSQQEWLGAIATAGGWRGTIVTDATVAPSQPANWEASLAVRTTRIRAVLGYAEPIGRAAGVVRTIAKLGDRKLGPTLVDAKP